MGGWQLPGDAQSDAQSKGSPAATLDSSPGAEVGSSAELGPSAAPALSTPKPTLGVPTVAGRGRGVTVARHLWRCHCPGAQWDTLCPHSAFPGISQHLRAAHSGTAHSPLWALLN